MKALLAFKALGDPVRFRIFFVLENEPLNVGEICHVLGLKQSRISRHLGILASAGLLESHRSGASIYYWRSHYFHGNDLGMGFLRSVGFLEDVKSFFEVPDICQQDKACLLEYLQSRESQALDYFQNQRDSVRNEQEGYVDSAFYYNALEGLLPKDITLGADLGCGNGELSSRLVPYCDGLICIDQSQTMLNQSEKKVDSKCADFRLGRLSHLPIGDNEVDLVVASMVLHHMPEPSRLFFEMRRILRDDGYLLLAELSEHTQEKMRSDFSDFWLGFSSEQIEQWMDDFNFNVIDQVVGKGEGGLESRIILAQAT